MAKPDHEGSEFDQVLLEAIDDALSVYGEETKSAIYVYLERALGIPKRKIPARIDEFSKGLEDLFGIGSKSVEILIIKNLHSKIGVVLEMKTSNPWVLPDLTFKEYVSHVKKYFEDVNTYEEKMSILIGENEAVKVYK